MTESEASVCPRCAVGCSLAYAEAADRATGREGPINRNGRLCPKGIAAFDDLGGDDRLTTPMVREQGKLVAASWADAYDRVVDGLGRILEERGPSALAFLGSAHCTNEENYLFQRIARQLGTNNVDNRARICHESAASAMRDRLGSSAMTNSQADLAEADAFLVVGANPAERQPIAFNTYVRPAVTDGAALIHVDPRETGTTRVADHHLAARPGTDAFLLIGMCAVLASEDLVDREFVEGRTEGYEEFVDRLDGVSVEAVADTCGVGAAEIRDAARAFGTADRGAAITGTGIEADDHGGTASADALLNLLLLTGNLGRRGTGMNLFRGLNNEQGAVDAGCQPARLPGHAPLDDPGIRARVETEWGIEPPADPGRDELSLVREFGEDVAGAWIFGENPAITRLDDDEVRRGMESLDCLVVQDVARTETVERADVVLPASAWAEKAGTVTSLDRVVQRVRAIRPPPDGVRRDLRILRDLGARLTDAPFAYDGPRDVFEELARISPVHRGLSYSAIERGGQRWPVDADGESVAVLHRDRFEHGGRRAPFVSVPLSEATPDDGLVLVTSRGIDEFVGETPDVSDRTVEIHPDDAGPLGLADGQRVVLETGDGRADASLSVTTTVRPGTVFAPSAVAERIAGRGRDPVHLSAADVEEA